MEFKYLTAEKLNTIKESIREFIDKHGEAIAVIELSSDSNENIEAFNFLSKDEEFSNIEFRLVEKSPATSIARATRMLGESLGCELDLVP